MHISHLWKILEKNPELNFLNGSKNKMKAKQIVTRLILNTDMSFHNKNLDILKELNQKKEFDTRHNEHKWVDME